MPGDEDQYKEVIAQYRQLFIWMSIAIGAVAGAVGYVTAHLIKSFRRHIEDKQKHVEDQKKSTEMILEVLQNVQETNKQVASAIEKNSFAIEANTEVSKAQTRAHERAADTFNELHKDILSGMTEDPPKRNPKKRLK